MITDRVFRASRSWAAPTLGALLLILAGGCGSSAPRMDYSKAGLVQVRGTVRMSGEPLPGAIVLFEDPENGTFSSARTDAAGHYSLMFDSVQPGVTKGRKTVRIKTSGSLGEDDPAARSGRELVPARYNTKSELAVEVTGGSSSTDFDLDAASTP